jgi:hypothetical protein
MSSGHKGWVEGDKLHLRRQAAKKANAAQSSLNGITPAIKRYG